MKKMKQRFKVFEGRIIEQMPRLLAERRKVISVKQIFELCLEKRTKGKRTSYNETHVATNLCRIVNADGTELKYVINHPAIYGLNPTTEVVYGALRVSQKQYNQKEGFVFSDDEVRRLLRDDEDKGVVLSQKMGRWLEFIAEGDTKLVQRFAKYVSDLELENYGYPRMESYSPLGFHGYIPVAYIPRTPCSIIPINPEKDYDGLLLRLCCFPSTLELRIWGIGGTHYNLYYAQDGNNWGGLDHPLSSLIGVL